MRQAVRAIVIRDDNLLVMKRNKFGDVYYTLIGGAIGPAEAPEQALVRELLEEAGMTVQAAGLVFIEEADPLYGTQQIFLCDGAQGDPVLSPNSEKYRISQMGQNTYQSMWLPLSELPGVKFRSEALKQNILSSLTKGFPPQPVTFRP